MKVGDPTVMLKLDRCRDQLPGQPACGWRHRAVMVRATARWLARSRYVDPLLSSNRPPRKHMRIGVHARQRCLKTAGVSVADQNVDAMTAIGRINKPNAVGSGRFSDCPSSAIDRSQGSWPASRERW